MKSLKFIVAGVIISLSSIGLTETYVLGVGISDYPTPTDGNGSLLRDANGDAIDNDLRGCVNDILALDSFLVSRAKIARKHFYPLIDDMATVEALTEGLAWLMSSSQPGDKVIFYFSGHGAQIPNDKVDPEPDNMEEVIVLYDGILLDDTLRKIAEIFRSSGRHFYAVLDCCYSGGMSRDVEVRTKRMDAASVAWVSNKRISANLETKEPSAPNKHSAAEIGSFTLIAGGQEGQPTSDLRFKNGKTSRGLFSLVLIDFFTEFPSKSVSDALSFSKQVIKELGFQQLPVASSTDKDRLNKSLFTSD